MSGVKGADIATSEGAWTYVILFVALINTVVSLYYYLKIVKAMYINHSDVLLCQLSRAIATQSLLLLFAPLASYCLVFAATFTNGLQQPFKQN